MPSLARAEDLADFIVRAADDAVDKRRFGLAVSLWRGVVAVRGEGDASAQRLADAWALGGEYDEAAEQLGRYAGAVDDGEAAAAARRRAEELVAQPRGFAVQPFRVEPAPKVAREAFSRGERLARAGRHEDAIKLYRAAIEMAPDEVAPYRALAAAYAALGKAAESRDLLVRYLRLRPFGRQADLTRKQLATSGILGRLAIASSFPCDEIWVNRQKAPPARGARNELTVAPGRYRLLCYSARYHFARYLDVDVSSGNKTQAQFRWALLENRLEPWGRIVIENPDRAEQMYDVGLWEVVGVPVPEDGRSLKVMLRAGDDSKTKETKLQLVAGQRYRLVW